MSTPKNPLDRFNTYTVKHVLVGFSHTEAAAGASGLAVNARSGQVGEEVKASCGKAFVIINEFMDFRHLISRLEWTFDYYSPISNTNTFLMGQLQVVDQAGGFFTDTFRTTAKKLGVAETHIALLLRTFIVGKIKEGDNETSEVIALKPFIFNMVDMTQTATNHVPNLYTLTFCATYNTFGQLPMFSNLYQTTITHKDGNLHKQIPKPEAENCGIMPRGSEDEAKSKARKKRLDRSKPMKTLKDVFDGLKEELQEQKYEHKRQLQEWMKKVRDDWIMKIEVPKQKKKDGAPLPLEYDVVLDEVYQKYEIDNRNMLNEQPEQSQLLAGIRSIPVPAGLNLTNVVPYLFKYAKRVGRDVDSGKSFKSNVSIVRKCSDKYETKLRVKQYELPHNEMGGKDTGPGESAVNPLQFEFQKGGLKDQDVIGFSMGVGSDVQLDVLEQQVDDPQAQIISGDREQMTYERIPIKSFFKSMFSGVRTLTNPKDFGMQDATLAAKIDASITDYINSQTTCVHMTMRGNPDLYQDLTRNPVHVSNEDADVPALYRFPEYFPLYAKLIIKIKDDAGLGQVAPVDEPLEHYHTYHYHISRVTSLIEGSEFIQQLRLQRTDDVT